MIRRMPLFAFAAAAVIILAACATTRLRSVTPSPGFEASRFRRVMIVGVFKNQDLRKIFEEEFVRQGEACGMQAVSSLAVLPSATPLEKAGVAPMARALKIDAVLVTRLISRTKVQSGGRPIRTSDPATQTDSQNINVALQVLLGPPVYVREYELVAVQTNLYSVADERRMWSGVSETEVMGDVPKLIAPFVKVILRELYKTHP